MAENNDLSGWMERVGILTPSQKAAQRMKEQQQQFANQLATIQAQQQQQQNNLKAGELSTGFGYPTYMINQGFSDNPGEAPIKPTMPTAKPYESPAQNDVLGAIGGGMFGADPSGRTPGIAPPEVTSKPASSMSDVFNRAAMAAAKSDPIMAMQLRAEALRAKQEEDKQARDEEDQKFQREEAARKRAQAGNSTEVFNVGVDGKPDWRQPMRYVRDADGQIIGTKPAGPPFKVSGGDVNISGLGEMMTGPQKGKAVTDFASTSIASENFINAAEPVYHLLEQGAKSGITGSLLAKIDNAVATVKTGIQAISSDPAALKSAELEITNSATWKAMAQKTHLSQSLLVGLMYADAAAWNKDGRISDADLRASGKKLGENLSDPASARDVLKQAIDQAQQRYTTEYENLPYADIKKDRKEQYDRIIARYDKFQKQFKPQATPVDKNDPAAVQARIKELEELLKANP